MDITNFMSWFINQVISIFTRVFSIMDSIQFMGTSLLKVVVTITILVPLLAVVLTLSNNVSVIGSRAEKVKQNKERKKHNEE